MARFDERFLDDLRSRVPVSEVARKLGVVLTRKGREFEGLSPFNAEKTPSFKINDEKRFYHCFSSGKHGDVFRLIMELDRVEFPAAVQKVAQLAGVTVPASGDRPKPSERRHAPAPDPEPPPADAPGGGGEPPRQGGRRITATYDYVSAEGELLYQNCRMEWEDAGKRRKTFGQRRPVPGQPGIWAWGLDAGKYIKPRWSADWFQDSAKRRESWGEVAELVMVAGVERSLFRLVEVMRERDAMPDDRTIYLPEGEKDALTLVGWGLVACTESGSKNWRPHMAETLRDMDVIVLVDNDEPGRSRGDTICRSLQGVARRVRLLDIGESWPDAQKGADVTDWRDAGNDKGAFLELVDRLPDWAPPPWESKFGAVRWQEMDGVTAAYEWLVQGLFPLVGITMWIGDTQTGKSFSATDAAWHVAIGQNYQGRAVQRRGVVYAAVEKGKGFRKRMKALRQWRGIAAAAPVPFAWLQDEFDLFGDEGATDALIAECRGLAQSWEEPLGLVVIDTHDAATPEMSELDKAEISVVRKRYARIAAELGCAVWVIQHTNAQGGLRGNRVLYNRIESAVLVEFVTEDEKGKTRLKDEHGRWLRRCRVLKQSEGEADYSWTFVLRQVTLPDLDSMKVPVTSCVVDTPGGHDAGARAGTTRPTPQGFYDLKPNNRRIFRALLQALERQGGPAPAGTRAPGNVRCVKVEHWITELARARAGEEADQKKLDDACKKAVQRACETWMDRLIQKDGPFVWRTDKRVVGVDAEPRGNDAPTAESVPGGEVF